ncbi:MAG: N(4)-(beta-N-acetylglucosaminyl)-L-asparaginase [Gemmatimonadota bacterium]|nr:N(4)-(beta-N-acetylglucosaminyl)-L-asparaginase [Gemmatimonadota bacterium]
MSGKEFGIDRREFVRHSVGVGAGALALGHLPEEATRPRSQSAGLPIIITSHSNDTARDAMRQGWGILYGGGTALDAVERGANVIEVDPNDSGVGYGGLPNENGDIQLDASIMDGRTYNAGAVASIENIKTPSSVARLVMERTDHVILVGAAALDFARSFGFKEEDLHTERSRTAWLRWREEHSESDDWGPPDHLKTPPGEAEEDRDPVEFHYGTTNVLAVDSNGNVSGITTTSGLSWKINGRIGDSPIIGAGLYVDNDIGAAGATGRGEDVIKSCGSFYVVMRMGQGRSPQQACEDAMEMIVHKYRNVNPDFFPSEKFVAINKDGEYGCASMGNNRGLPRMTIRTPDGLEVFEGTTQYTG